jgi:hypothetical protein
MPQTSLWIVGRCSSPADGPRLASMGEMPRGNLGFLLVAAACWAGSSARADDGSVLDRPLLLPLWTVEAELAGGAASRPTSSGGEGSGIYSELALSVGMPLHLQFGMYWREAFNEDGQFQTNQTSAMMMNLQRSFGDMVAARVDFGMAASSAATEPGITFGLGAPFRYRFDDHFALVSGQTNGRAFGSPSADGDWATYTPSADLLTLRSVGGECIAQPPEGSPFPNDRGLPGGSSCGGGYYGTVGLPVGAILEPRAGIAIEVRTGARYSFSFGGASPPTPTSGTASLFIPFALDVLFSPWSHLDLGLTAETAGTPTTLGANRSLVLWTRARL